MGKCENCHEEYEKTGTCKNCKIGRYCSQQCQKEDWNQHKKTCEKQTKMLKKIMKILEKRGLYRHINGETTDCRIQNLDKVTPQQALLHKDWTVDACCALTDIQYLLWEKVRGNPPDLFENKYAVMCDE